MEFNEKEIIEALETLQQLCRNMGQNCADCPLRVKNDADCLINYEFPYEWDINSERKTSWRAFN